MLADYGVLVGTDRVVTRGYTGQMHAASPALPAAAGHPLARSLPAAALTLYECRSVRLLASVRQNQTQAAPLLISHPWPRAWAQDAADGTSSAGNATLRGPVSMAVAVERRSTAQPVLVVAGDGEFAGNRALALPAGRLSYGLLVASVNWLRGRKELLADIPPLRHEPYQLAGDPADHRTLVWTSSLLLCAAIVTAGTTIWTVRRTG